MNRSEKFRSPEAGFLKGLFAAFDNSVINYAVMRNYASLPDSVDGSDLDILIDPEQEMLARACILGAIEAAGGVPIGCVNTVGLFKIFAFGRGSNSDDEWWGLRMDISLGVIYAGCSNMISDSVWSNHVEEHHGVKVLSSDLAAMIGVVKDLLYVGLLPTKYQSVAAVAAKNSKRWPSILSALSPMGDKVLDRFGKLCIENPDSSSVEEEAKFIRRSLEYRAFLNSPLRYLIKKVMYHGSRAIRIIKPPGKMLAILGTDGSGKSTVIEAIRPVLMEATHGELSVEHLRPRMLPPLGSYKQGGVVDKGIVTEPHGVAPSGYVVSMIRLAYYLMDYVVGYWVRVRPLISKSPTIFLFDRYAYDLLIDPKRLRISLPRWVLRVFTFLVPKPDLIICLHGDPVVLTARKKELPLSEVRRQVDALIAFSKKEKKAVLVSTESEVDETRDLVLEAIKRTCEE